MRANPAINPPPTISAVHGIHHVPPYVFRLYHHITTPVAFFYNIFPKWRKNFVRERWQIVPINAIEIAGCRWFVRANEAQVLFGKEVTAGVCRVGLCGSACFFVKEALKDLGGCDGVEALFFSFSGQAHSG